MESERANRPTAGLNSTPWLQPPSTFLHADWLSHRDDQKELILFVRSVIVTCISRLLDTGRYSVDSDAPTFQVRAARMPHGGAP